MFHKNTPRLWQVTQPVLWQSKAVTESIKSIKFLEKLTLPCNILYAWNTQISLGNFQGWNSSRAVWHFTCQPGTGTLDFYLGTYSLVQKKNSSYTTQVALSPLSTVHHFRTELYCTRCSERFFSGLESKLAFFMEAKVTFFQCVKILRAMSHFTATSGLDPDVFDKFSGSASLHLRTLNMVVLSDHHAQNLQRSERR